MKRKIKLPPIGQRIIKSAVGVFLCYLIYILRGQNGIPFYSMIAALQCIQPYTNKTHEMAVQRFTGTVIGALSGLTAILIEIYILDIYDNFAGYFLNTLFVIPVIYATVLMKKQNVSYFSCVVYLSIAVNHMTDPNPFIFVMNRVLDTFIGISVGIIVNHMRLPRKKVKNCLFVTSLDDMISPVKKEISSYSIIEINRMIESGMNFTIATMRTPASLIEPVNGINLKMPVIVMDGAALYDIKENTFLNAYVISNESSREIADKIRGYGMNCFVNALCDDTLVIFYLDLENCAEKGMFQTLKRSPYRSYVHREPAENDRTIYIMTIDKTEKIEAFYKILLDEEYD
ncbi:MAG: HAD hydrolase family protein, partial [Ruminococcus sp.]|nr:HAD hydrolase family protein [Ruminococcus sp.]